MTFRVVFWCVLLTLPILKHSLNFRLLRLFVSQIPYTLPDIYRTWPPPSFPSHLITSLLSVPTHPIQPARTLSDHPNNSWIFTQLFMNTARTSGSLRSYFSLLGPNLTSHTLVEKERSMLFDILSTFPDEGTGDIFYRFQVWRVPFPYLHVWRVPLQITILARTKR